MYIYMVVSIVGNKVGIMERKWNLHWFHGAHIGVLVGNEGNVYVCIYIYVCTGAI